MAADPIFFRDLAHLCLAAFLGGGIAWLARQPLILGFVVGGILISPLTPGPGVERVHPFERFAGIGVILGTLPLSVEKKPRGCHGVSAASRRTLTRVPHVGQSSAQTAGVSMLGEGVPWAADPGSRRSFHASSPLPAVRTHHG
jgi:hypothetical protein